MSARLKNTLTASLQRGKAPYHSECPVDVKQSDGVAPVMLELWKMQRTPSLPSLQAPLWILVVALNRVLSMCQTEQFDHLSVFTKCVQKFLKKYLIQFSLVGWGCRIHQLHLCRGVWFPTKSVLSITLNNLVVRLMYSWPFGECGLSLHCHLTKVHSSSEW